MARDTTIDLWRRFRPTPSQLAFLGANDFGVLFSSGYGSGKSSTGCRWGIEKAVQYPGSRGLIGRLTATDLRDTTMVTFWKEMARIGFKRDRHYTHNKSDKEITFHLHEDERYWSTIVYRHLDDPDALGSLELNWAVLDEGSEISDRIYQTLSSSRMRWHLPDCDLEEQVVAAIEAGATDEEIAAIPCDCLRAIRVLTNPGASGYLRAVTRGEVPNWRWIRAKPGENPYNGPDYYAKMERDRAVNGDIWMRRFYDGDWDAFEGQRFPMFDRDRHVSQKVLKPERHHLVVEGWDFGHRETFVSWLAYNPRGGEPVFVFAELQMREVKEPSDVRDRVMEIRKQYGVSTPVCMGDPAGTAANQFSAVSPISAYEQLGIYIAPCQQGKSPQGRADRLTEFLAGEHKMYDGSAWPGIVLSPNCPATAHSIINLRWKDQEGRLGEDPREVFLKKDDHGFDALTYALTVVPSPTSPPPARPRNRSLGVSAQTAIREWAGT